MEEYEHGRSRIWYWKQVLIAIAVSFYTDIRTHSLLTLRALATGWAAWLSYYYVKSWVFSHAFFHVLSFKLPLAFGHEGLVWWILRLGAWGGSGWLVARLHREHATTMVLAFATSIFVWKLQILPWTCHLTVDAIGDARYRFELVAELMGVILPPVCSLLGGLSGSRAERQPNAQPVILS